MEQNQDGRNAVDPEQKQPVGENGQKSREHKNGSEKTTKGTSGSALGREHNGSEHTRTGKSGSRRRRQKRAQKKRRIFLAAVLLCLAAAAGSVIWLLMPSRKQADRREYFGLADGVAYGLIINQERVGSFPLKHAGYWYLDADTVYSYISTKFYYDGSELLYTNPTKTYFAKPGERSYRDDSGLSYKLEYEPFYEENGTRYLALEYLKLMDYDYYLADTDQMYVWIWNNWSELQTAEVKKDTAVRVGSGIKEAVIDSAAAGETVIILEEGSEWDMVQTERGLIGCVRRRTLGEAGTLTASTPDNRPLPEYTTHMLDETVCMAWHQIFTESGVNQLDDYLKSADSLNVLCPTWFTISDEQGNIKSLADPDYVEKAHEKGIKVWGLVEDLNIDVEWSQLYPVTEHRRHLVDSLMEEAERVGLDGINIDIERPGSQNGDALLQFVRELSAACRKAGLTLSMNDYSPMPHTAYYDRAQQAEVIDYVVVMAYDEHYSGDSKAGSTSSLGWVKQSAERTLLEVPKEKLVIGLCFYSRLWRETPESEVTGDDRAKLVTNDNSKFGTYLLTSKGISMQACKEIVKEKGLSMIWLDDEQQYYVEYEENNSLYRLWIEDETSMRLKLAAAFSYEPAGVAFFKLGLETSDVWGDINSYVE